MKSIKYLISISIIAMASNLFAEGENYARCDSTTLIIPLLPPIVVDKFVCTGKDFVGCNMSDQIYNNRDLWNAKLGACNSNRGNTGTIRSNFTNAKFVSADLRNATLNGGIFEKADFKDARLMSTQIRFTNLYGANFERADLEGADFYGTDMFHSDFILRPAKNVKNIKLEGVHNIPKNLSGLNLSGVKFNWLDLRSADFRGSSTILDGANFSNARLLNAHFNEANLKGTVFNNAYLSGADFTSANLQGAKLSGAVIDISTKFEGARLGGATWIDGKTICAEGSISKCSIPNPGVTLIAVNSLKTQRFNLKYLSGTRRINEIIEINSHKIISLPVLEKPLGTASVVNQEPLCQKPIENSGIYWFVIALGNDNNPKCITDYSASYTTDDLKPHIVEAYNETRMTPMILEYQIDDNYNQQKYTMARTEPIEGSGGQDGFNVAYTPKNATLVAKSIDGQVICAKSVPNKDKYKKFYQFRLFNNNTCTLYSHD